jgi:4-hydroxy-4-methyl-2-oxoglutarate aldolase
MSIEVEVLNDVRRAVELAQDVSAATLHEAGGKVGALPARIAPVRSGMRVIGLAYPVLASAGDNLWLHRAIYAAAPGDVLVVDVGDVEDYGYWGEVMAVAAQARGILGLVTNGGVRDGDQMRARGFPAFSAGNSIRGTGKDPEAAGVLGAGVRIGDVTVRHGDLVVGDSDGVVVIPAARALEIVRSGVERDEAELDMFGRLEAGETTLHIY